jgi:MraZ protein
MSDDVQIKAVRYPRGTFETRCDDKGRIKLPGVFKAYLEAIGEKDLFVTTLDKKVARIYPNSVWEKNEAFFATHRENPKEIRRVSMVASHYGQDAEVDGQGRVLMPTNLRRELGLEKSTVWLLFSRGGFDVYSDALYQQRLGEDGSESMEESVDVLTQLGLN